MKKTLLSVCLSFSLLWLSFPMKSSALTFDTLPISQSSQQWKVKIGNPDIKKPNVKKERLKFNEYSLDIENIGQKDIVVESFEVYRDEPNTKTKYELFTMKGDEYKPLEAVHHQNLPVALTAKRLEVIITWSKKGIEKNMDRQYQETFVFETK